MWSGFRQLPGVEYLEDDLVANLAWKISRNFNLPTLYDAAFLAVAETVTLRTGEECEFWTADEKLVNSLNGKKGYVNLLNDM
ncbi:type II toxin-antitoxin system VapC family toxin [Desulforamulus profundi]|uniref:type II toxin-antitoxin system VapC family toxin n=1 Tax=Desulforamulus profundi TaxID=1383067 RepID=UPI001EE625A3|nr:type II toxin-antitoxin system VapC family toxin [Desulforamulus profundi]